MEFILLAIVVFVFWVILTYNGLVVFRNRAKEAWA
ncbi:MAG: hypothetical protein COX90_03135, partial [Candidatus Nealsonbacteria bacterium CG_4_10_14_0_2_um_filter_38_17]